MEQTHLIYQHQCHEKVNIITVQCKVTFGFKHTSKYDISKILRNALLLQGTRNVLLLQGTKC